MVVRNEADWLTATLGGEVVLMSVKGNDYIGLDEVGASIWSIIKTPRTPDEVCALVAKEYNATPDQCRDDVTRLLDTLKQQRAAVERS